MKAPDSKRFGLGFMMVALTPVLLILLFLVGLWLSSVNEFKAPPGRVVPIPAGFDALGERSSGGSGGTTVRWLFLLPPEGVTPESGIVQLRAMMLAEGWADVIGPDHGSGAFFGDDATYGLVRRDDEWAGFDTNTSIDPWLHDSLDVSEFEAAGSGLIIVSLEYTGSGVGRRQLFD